VAIDMANVATAAVTALGMVGGIFAFFWGVLQRQIGEAKGIAKAANDTAAGNKTELGKANVWRESWREACNERHERLDKRVELIQADVSGIAKSQAEGHGMLLEIQRRLRNGQPR